MERKCWFGALGYVLLGILVFSTGKTLKPTTLLTPLKQVDEQEIQEGDQPIRHSNDKSAQVLEENENLTTKSNQNGTLATKGATGPKDDNDGLPIWAYILIGAAAIALVIVLVSLGYIKFMKWKDHGTYMVWDEAELETSPAFTRESEFLLETQTGGQELITPELQLYEIPLDSDTNPRITYIGAKRVAPKKQEDKRRPSRDFRRKEDDYNVPSLTRYTKRDTVYNSVTDTCLTSVLSEGTLNGDGSTSNHTLATVMFSNGGLNKYGSTSQQFDDSKGTLRDKSHSMGNRTRSVSNLIQSRPLPAVPINKRFSKSLEKFRFFHTLPVIRPKRSNKDTLQEPTSYTTLVKSASYGSHLNRTEHNDSGLPIIDHPRFSSRKSSLDMETKMSAHKFSHRKSKSLDTLTLLKEINWNDIDVDVYHSYESVHGTKHESSEYASVSDSQPSSPTAFSDISPQKSPVKSNSLASPVHEVESIYESVSQEELQRSISQTDQGTVNEGTDSFYDSSTLSSVSSDATSPYASVRISQIPGLSFKHGNPNAIYSTKSPENSGSSLETPENSGSTAGELKPSTNSARSSTHTYIELFPEQTNRDSVISETSSGYARPVDVIKGVGNIDLQEKDETVTTARQSLADVEILVEDTLSFENRTEDLSEGTCTVSGKEVYDNPVIVADDEIRENQNNEPELERKQNIHDMEEADSGSELAYGTDILPESVVNDRIDIQQPLNRTDSNSNSECEI